VPTILAFDCSTEYCSVALCTAPRVYARDVHAGHGHAGQLIDLAAELLQEAGIALSHCDAIAFGSGPGSFTGLRVACAVAQGVAYGADLPVLPVGTLAALAEQARTRLAELPADSLVLCAQDARMGEVYWALMRWRDGQWSESLAPRLSLPAELGPCLREPIYCGCGSAFSRFADPLVPLVEHVLALDHPGAVAIASLARTAYQSGRAVRAAAARPLYVRDQVALTTEERVLRGLVA